MHKKHVNPRYLLLLPHLNSHRIKIGSDYDFRLEISVPSDSQVSGEIREIGDIEDSDARAVDDPTQNLRVQNPLFVPSI